MIIDGTQEHIYIHAMCVVTITEVSQSMAEVCVVTMDEVSQMVVQENWKIQKIMGLITPIPVSGKLSVSPISCFLCVCVQGWGSRSCI